MSTFRNRKGLVGGGPRVLAVLACLLVGCAESAQRAVSADRAELEACVSQRSESAPECQVLRERLKTASELEEEGATSE